MLQTQTAPRLFFRVWDSSQNPVTSITIGDLSIVVHRPGYTDGSALSLALTTDPTSTTVGHVHHVGSGLYWVNISTALINSLQGTIVAKGTYTGGSVDGIVEAVIPITLSTDNTIKLNKAISTSIYGTVDASATTTNIPIKTISTTLTVSDQVKGLLIKFATDTATAALRGQGATITASTTSMIYCSALTTAPAEDDIFIIQ